MGTLARPGRPKDAWIFPGSSLVGTFVASSACRLARGDAAGHEKSSKARDNLSKEWTVVVLTKSSRPADGLDGSETRPHTFFASHPAFA